MNLFLEWYVLMASAIFAANDAALQTNATGRSSELGGSASLLTA
jgi:hypothetical protein